MGMSSAVALGDRKGFHEALASWTERCGRFAGSGGGTSVPAKKKVHRSSSVQLVVGLENGLKQTVGEDVSLRFYMLDPDSAKRPADGLLWPLLSMSADCGPDVMCGLNFLQRHLHVNIDFYADDSHGVKNDMKAVLKESGLWRWTLLSIAAFNAGHSPFWECMRFQQIRDSIHETMGHVTPTQDPLFQSLFHQILRDKQHEHRQTDENVEAEVYQELAENACWFNMGNKVSLMRFCQQCVGHLHRVLHWRSQHGGDYKTTGVP